uniref:N6-adenosine-methyltransferase 70 kDa subunit n=1 Tax=Lygus hesperus TaxID=30085 RepID=A0A0A9X7R0_LYGHE
MAATGARQVRMPAVKKAIERRLMALNLELRGPEGIWSTMYPRKKQLRTSPCSIGVHDITGAEVVSFSQWLVMATMPKDMLTFRALSMTVPSDSIPSCSCRLPYFLNIFDGIQHLLKRRTFTKLPTSALVSLQLQLRSVEIQEGGSSLPIRKLQSFSKSCVAFWFRN